MTPKTKALDSIRPRKTKSKACSKVLQLMDADLSYSQALRNVLEADKRLNKQRLEKELSYYI